MEILEVEVDINIHIYMCWLYHIFLRWSINVWIFLLNFKVCILYLTCRLNIWIFEERADKKPIRTGGQYGSPEGQVRILCETEWNKRYARVQLCSVPHGKTNSCEEMKNVVTWTCDSSATKGKKWTKKPWNEFFPSEKFLLTFFDRWKK